MYERATRGTRRTLLVRETRDARINASVSLHCRSGRKFARRVRMNLREGESNRAYLLKRARSREINEACRRGVRCAENDVLFSRSIQADQLVDDTGVSRGARRLLLGVPCRALRSTKSATRGAMHDASEPASRPRRLYIRRSPS